jgi:hypothetical protein
LRDALEECVRVLREQSVIVPRAIRTDRKIGAGGSCRDRRGIRRIAAHDREVWLRRDLFGIAHDGNDFVMTRQRFAKNARSDHAARAVKNDFHNDHFEVCERPHAYAHAEHLTTPAMSGKFSER